MTVRPSIEELLSHIGQHFFGYREKSGGPLIAGILHRAWSIAAFTNPTTNSYRRLVSGFEAPINLAYSSRNRSASVRNPMYSPAPKAKRIEVRFPDLLANPYSAFTAMLMAGLDGLQRRLDPGQPLDKDISAFDFGRARRSPEHAGIVGRGIEQPEEGSRVLVEARCLYRRRDRDLDRLQDVEGSQRDAPAAHPYEFTLYFDAQSRAKASQKAVDETSRRVSRCPCERDARQACFVRSALQLARRHVQRGS
jgi:hypothetical protein